MLINSIRQIPLAVPYPGNGGVLPVERPSHRFQVNFADGDSSGRQTSSRVGAVERANFTIDDQRRQQEPRDNIQIFLRENKTTARGSLPGAQILGELISRMGGAGVYSGPGQVLNIVV